jgi:Zn-dependent protease
VFSSGFLPLVRLRGIPIRLHWSFALGALLFGGLRFAPAFWLGFFLLVLIHELGHAFLVRRTGHGVVGIDITGFGGVCHWSGYASDTQRGIIAWGGVLAQAVLLLVTLAVLFVAGPPASAFTRELAAVFTTTNLWLIGLNLLPIPPLDGAEAWRLVTRFFRGRRFSLPKWRQRSRSVRDVWPEYYDKKPPRSEPPRQAPRGSSAKGDGQRELADVLRQIGDEAGQARRRD